MNISHFFQAAPNVFLFKHAPVWFCTRYLAALGSLYYFANRGERAQIEKNVLAVFRKGRETRDLLRKIFRGIFFHYSEKLIMAHRNYAILKEELRGAMEYSGIEHLDGALERGGVILITGHFGGVEFMPLALALRGYPVTMIVKFQTESLRRSLMERAVGVGVELIDARSDQVMNHFLDALKRGRILLTECDEVDAWKPKDHRTMEAFGGRVILDRTLEIICRRTGSTPLASFMVREGRRYRLAVVPVTGSENGGEGEISVRIMKTFEKFVMTFPDQWYQWRKFHKMRPEPA